VNKGRLDNRRNSITGLADCCCSFISRNSGLATALRHVLLCFFCGFYQIIAVDFVAWQTARPRQPAPNRSGSASPEPPNHWLRARDNLDTVSSCLAAAPSSERV
jgi:hypothetical protein